jgi:hypothetical protein
LNTIGKIGQGPGEYINISNYCVDEERQEVWIVSASNGVFAYGYDGTFHRTVSRVRMDNFRYTFEATFFKYGKDFYMQTIIPLFRSIPNPEDSLWSFRRMDSTFTVRKQYQNPSYKGYEEEIVVHNAGQSTNYLGESPLRDCDFYDRNFEVMYYGVDTIYRMNTLTQEFDPAYCLTLGARPGFAEARYVRKDRSFFDYLWVYDFYESKDYIYFMAAQSDNLYTMRYSKTNGEVCSVRREGSIRESPRVRGLWYRSENQLKLILKNDVSGGGDFTVARKRQGKYWLSLLDPSTIKDDIDITALERESVTDESAKQRLLSVIKTAKEDDNPILLIGILK